MVTGPPASAARPSRWLRAGLLLAALIAGVFALRELLRFSAHLPQIRFGVLQSTDRLVAARDRVLSSGDPAAREAWNTLYASRIVVDALLGRSNLSSAEVEGRLADAAARVRSSALVRAHLALAREWSGERSGSSARERATSVRFILSGMQLAALAHKLEAAITAFAAAYGEARLGAATARALAEQTVGHQHEMFAQLLSARFRALAEACEAEGDADGARSVRAALARILRAFVLEPGPASLRLCAAALLADTIASDGSTQSAPAGAALTDAAPLSIAQDLRSWRQQYLDRIRTLPISVLAIRSEPVLCLDEYERAVRSVVRCTWIASALGVSLLVTVLAGWCWLTDRGRWNGAPRAALVALLATVVLCAGSMILAALPLDSLAEELRRDFSSPRYWWRHPFVAAALTLLMLAVAPLVRRRAADARPSRLGALGAGATLFTLMLSAALAATCGIASVALERYESSAGVADSRSVETVLGDNAERLLVALRAWTP
ncbi:MAG: hypothetical protein HRF50_08850 [Phycisphaerae bacterium]|jgi:hypothetical protein